MSVFHCSKSSVLLISISVLLHINLSNAGFIFRHHECSKASVNAIDNLFQTRLSSLMHLLSSRAGIESFHVENSDVVSGLFLCRGDISQLACKYCVAAASERIQKEPNCISSTRANLWLDLCMVRYSTTAFLGDREEQPLYPSAQVETTVDPVGTLSLMYNLVSEAPYTQMMFQNGLASLGGGTQQRYGLAQCTRDISNDDCSRCLMTLLGHYLVNFQANRTWYVLSPSCNIMYEERLSSEQESSNTHKRTMKKKAMTIMVAALATSIVVASALVVLVLFRRKRRQRGTQTSLGFLLHDLTDLGTKNCAEGGRQRSNSGATEEVHFFDFPTIVNSTNSFSQSNKLGEGGFGPVYKGMLHDGKEIAVKRLSIRSGQGLEAFKTEVTLISKLQHRNLVKLLGSCVNKDERLLIYEYVPNKSLDTFLFDCERSKQLDWNTRANIVNGMAKGIQYLHEDSRLKIIHRDLSASNVLLDEEMNPKISNFGIARIFERKQNEASTKRVIGTYGYIAPEYAMEGLFSAKSDVYSFGVLMLEIISGKKNSTFNLADSSESLLTYAWRLWSEGKGAELIDPNIVDNSPVSEAVRWIHIALLCVQDDPAERPTMSSIVLMLGGRSANMLTPSLPFSSSRPSAYDHYESSQVGPRDKSSTLDLSLITS